MRVRVFIDFWNFQLRWNERVSGQCDWRKLPMTLVQQASTILAVTGDQERPILEETILYASVDPVGERPLKGWLTNTVDRMPSYKVKIRERRPQPKTIHCRHCSAEFDRCGQCGARYMPRTEKGVDAAIVTDLLAFAFQKSYDVGILVSEVVPEVVELEVAVPRLRPAGW